MHDVVRDVRGRAQRRRPSVPDAQVGYVGYVHSVYAERRKTGRVVERESQVWVCASDVKVYIQGRYRCGARLAVWGARGA